MFFYVHKRVACDWKIDGKAQEDRCGLCHGDGTQCITTRGQFNTTIGTGYAPIVTLPEGVRNVRVTEDGDAANYLAIRDTKGEFFLNGDWLVIAIFELNIRF